jgi:flagellar operon protein
MTSNGPFLYPNVGSVPSRVDVDSSRQSNGAQPVPGEFDQALEKVASHPQESSKADLGSVRQPLKFSAHAMQRLNDRKIHIDPATMQRVNSAVDKAASKGVQDTLVLTKDAALIVSVKNRTVVTAMDRNAMDGNVFTNIDGAVIV